MVKVYKYEAHRENLTEYTANALWALLDHWTQEEICNSFLPCVTSLKTISMDQCGTKLQVWSTQSESISLHYQCFCEFSLITGPKRKYEIPSVMSLKTLHFDSIDQM